MFSESVVARYWKYVIVKDGCWGWNGSKSKGYGQLSVGRGVSPAKIHRVSWFIHYGNISKGLSVCHKCDNPECSNPEHLFLGTQRDNIADAFKKGRIQNYTHGLGEKNNVAKLTMKQVKEIRKEFAKGAMLAELSNKYQNTNIIRIVRNKSYFDPDFKPINGNKKPRPFLRKLTKKTIKYIMDSSLSSRKVAKKLGVSKTLILSARKGDLYE